MTGFIAKPEGIREEEPVNTGADVLSQQFSGDTGILESKSRRIQTLDDALAAAKVDLETWEVERYIINKWEVGAKIPNPDNNIERLEISPLWQVKVWLRRKVPSLHERIFNGLTDRLAAIEHLPPRKRYTRVRDPHLLEVSLFDPHFGKLAWHAETGEDYDIHIAERIYENAVNDLLAKARGFAVEKILFVFGQDFFTINNAEFTTVHGTSQDTDGRLAKIFETGALAVIHAIDRCLCTAPVDILWIPGNHDRETSWFLAKYLSAWYRSNNAVAVDAESRARKYCRYGVNLIGFTHGDEEPHRDLPTIMAAECRDIWGDVWQCEWHIGHLHKRKETRYLAGDTFGGIGVRILPSLSGIDSWHYRKGYVQETRSAEAYLWSYDRGYTGHLASVVKKEEYSGADNTDNIGFGNNIGRRGTSGLRSLDEGDGILPADK